MTTWVHLFGLIHKATWPIKDVNVWRQNQVSRLRLNSRSTCFGIKGCVPFRWSRLGWVIRDHSDHGRSNEPMNPLWTRIHRFIWSTMIRVISDHWSWSGSSQRNAPFGFHKFPKAFVDVISHAKPKSAFLWDYLHQDLWSKTTWNIETGHDPRHLLVCSLLSFIVFIEGWCVAWVASVSARVLYENGHSQESHVPLNLHPFRDALCSCALCFKTRTR